MGNKFSLPRGTKDILFDKTPLWQELESISRGVLSTYGYNEIKTPCFEDTELFARSMGQTSDVVQKQILSLMSQKKGDAEDIQASGLSLRPEGTASIVRSYIENGFDRKESLSKLYYIGPMFRGERPQKGRLRQFNQIGVEAIGPGSRSAYLDAEIIALNVALLKKLGVEELAVQINTLGTLDDKSNLSKMLSEKLNNELSGLCEDCQKRYNKNIFRVLDCKSRSCQTIISKLDIGYDWLGKESFDYFSQVKENLDALGVEYKENANLVRGLDYYTQTVFEIISPALASQQNTLSAGGRYDTLVKQLGGPEVDAVGFALGVERVLLASNLEDTVKQVSIDAYVVSLDEKSLKSAFGLLNELRSKNISSDMSYKASKLKKEMGLANKRGAQFVLIIGEDEIRDNVVSIKDMERETQEKVSINEIVEYLNKKIKKG